MKASTVKSILVGSALIAVSGTAMAHGNVGFSISFGVPAPVYAAPAPVVVAPAPVYYPPQAVVYPTYPAPAYGYPGLYAPRPVYVPPYYYGHRSRWHGHGWGR